MPVFHPTMPWRASMLFGLGIIITAFAGRRVLILSKDRLAGRSALPLPGG
jgi:hypothetical protein